MRPRPKAEPTLQGARVLLTRALDDAEAMRRSLERLGAHILVLPTIEIQPPVNPIPLDAALGRLGEFDWIVFSSRYAVRAVFQRLAAARLPALLPSEIRVAAVGPSTAAELRKRGVRDVLEPEEATATSLVVSLERTDVVGKRVLIPAGDLARPELRQGIERAGAEVLQVVAYRNVMPTSIDHSMVDSLCHGEIDVVAVASPSAIRNLAAMLGPDTWCLRRARIACAGATTAQAVARLGLHPYVADGAGAQALEAAIVRAYANRDETSCEL